MAIQFPTANAVNSLSSLSGVLKTGSPFQRSKPCSVPSSGRNQTPGGLYQSGGGSFPVKVSSRPLTGWPTASAPVSFADFAWANTRATGRSPARRYSDANTKREVWAPQDGHIVLSFSPKGKQP